MDIEFPSWLEFLRYLCPQWPDPPASETGMREIAGVLRAAAAQLGELIPELEGVPAQTAAVLSGDTAEAFTAQFSQLLSGSSSVHHDVAALESLADLADTQATQIQYFKLMAISTLVIAAATIAWALFNADWSLGASLAEIPIAELLAENTIRQLAQMVLEEIAETLAATLSRTALVRVLVEGGVGALIGAGQELLVQGFQDGEGWRSGIDMGQVGKSALTMGVSGMAAGVVGHDLGELVGEGGSLPVRILKGGVSGAASGVAANAVGNFVGGGDVGANTFLGAAMGFAGGFAPGHAEAGGGGGASALDPTAPPAGGLDDTRAPAGQASPAGDAAAEAAASGTDGGPPADTAPPSDLARAPSGPASPGGDAAVNGTDGGPQAHAVSPAAPAGEPGAAAGERAAGSPAGAASSGVGDPGARSTDGATTGAAAGRAAAHAETAAGAGLPSSGGTPGVSATAGGPGDAAAAGAGVAHPEIVTSACYSPNAGLSSPTLDTHAGPADISPAGKSSSEPAGMPAAGRFEITAAPALHPEPGARDTPAEQAAHAASADPAAQAERPEVGSHPVGRQDSGSADRQQRPADPLTQRRDPSTRPGGRPGTLRRSGPGRDPGDPVPAATRDPDPLAANDQIGAIKAHHDDNGPGPKPESHQGGGDGGDGPHTPDPSTAGGGASDYCGGDGSHRGGAGGATGDGGARSGEGDDFARAQRADRAEDPTVRQADPNYADPLVRWRVVRLPGQPELEAPWERPNYEFEGALDDAARGAIEAAGGRALNSRVGLVGGADPRVVIVNWEGSDHDAALTATLDQFPESAAALTQRGAQIQYLSGRVDPHDKIQLSEIDSPEVRSATIESGWWQGTEVTYRRDAEGYWCPVSRDVPLDRIPPARTGSELTASHPLLQEHHGENNPNLSSFVRVHYMSAAELEVTRVFVGPDGRLYRAVDGTPFHAPDWALFAMDRGGNLYATKPISGRLQGHSSFFAGAPVAAAGEIKVVHGRMLAMNDANGHYWATANANDLGLQLLCEGGLILAHGFLRYDHHIAVRKSTLTDSKEQSPGQDLRGETMAIALETAGGRTIPDPVAAGPDDFALPQRDYRAQDSRVRNADAVSELPGIDEIQGD